jgi:hypothetical protein
MTQMFTIEEDSGTFTGSLRRHNGYYAGDFTSQPVRTATDRSAPERLRPSAIRVTRLATPTALA